MPLVLHMLLCIFQGPVGAAAAAGGPTPATSGLSRQEKAKLLWGAKKDAAAAGVVPAAGNNRWEAAEFNDTQQKLKFQRLMGAHHDSHMGLQTNKQQAAAGVEASAAAIMGREQQQKVLSDVERQFIQGLRRADGRTVGLGL